MRCSAASSSPGCLTAAVAFGGFTYEKASNGEIATARNAAFSTLVFAELLRAFGARSETKLLGASREARSAEHRTAEQAEGEKIHERPQRSTRRRAPPVRRSHGAPGCAPP